MADHRSSRGFAEIDAGFFSSLLDSLRRRRYEARRRAALQDPTASRPWTEVFDEAAERVRGKIRGHGALFPGDEEVARLLGHLADHLLELDLDVNAWLKACGCSRDARDRFVSRLGSLKTYLDERRVAVAAEAIRMTPAPLGRIGRRAGFKVPRTFQRTFERVLGMHPSDLPRPEADSGKVASGAAPDLEDPVFGTRLLATYWRRQVTLGLVGAERVAELRRLLRERYKGLRDAPWSQVPRRGRRIGVRRLLTGVEYEDPAAAFEPTQAAIRHDEQSAGRDLARLFSEIYRHLCTPNLRLDQVLEAAKVQDESAWRRFAAVVGQSPWSYIRQYRMETATRLALLTSLGATQICRRVGYTSPTSFHRSFTEFAGLGPSEYRGRARRLLERGGEPPWDFADAWFWTEAVSGELMVAEAAKLDAYLGRLFPGRSAA